MYYKRYEVLLKLDPFWFFVGVVLSIIVGFITFSRVKPIYFHTDIIQHRLAVVVLGVPSFIMVSAFIYGAITENDFEDKIGYAIIAILFGLLGLYPIYREGKKLSWRKKLLKKIRKARSKNKQ